MGKPWMHDTVWRTPFKAQLREFPRSKKDDFIDAVSGAIDQLKKIKKRSGSGRATGAFGNGLTYIEANTPPPV